MKTKKTLKILIDLITVKTIFPFFTKTIKYKQFMCKVEDKMGKQKGLHTIIIDYHGFFLQNKLMRISDKNN